MQWHEGEVCDAINKVNKSDQYLIVFLRNENNSSVNYNSILESSREIHEILKNCVCLNLLQDGTDYKQFFDVYKVSEVPSIYIISHLGQVVDIIKEDINEDSLINKLKKIISHDLTASKSVDNDSKGAGEIENQDDKMIEIREKLAEKHRQRKEEEKAKEIEDELSRRDIGKKLVELKKFQKEQEENEIKDEIRRKKQEDKDARDKVLRQIEEDKQERKKRFVNQDVSPSVNIEDNFEDVEIKKRECINFSTTRLQFRFPDGSFKNSIFNCDDKFSTVRQFVAAHVRENMNSRKFEIKQFFPRKTLSTADDLLSLQELHLVPSVSLAVIFFDQTTISAQANSLTSLIFSPINVILTAILTIFQWLKSKLSVTEHGNQGNRDTTDKSVTNWEERQRRLIAAESRTIKKDGNVAQLSDISKKEDDDDATWNGNSTQQM